MHHPSPSLDDAPADQQKPAGAMGKAEWVAFGAAVRARRQAKGLTQIALAKKAKIGRAHLSQIETGSVGTSHDTMVKIAKALGVPLRDLITH